MPAPKGRQLSEGLGLQVQQSRYSKDGNWYENPNDFPCAFHDEEGYVIVDSQEHWAELQVAPAYGAPFFAVGRKTNVKGVGIRGMPGYVRHHAPQQVTLTGLEPERPPFNPLAPALQEYAIKDIISDGCFLSEPRLVAILERLRFKKNIILQGPPGTGKTWLAKRLAYALVGSRSESQVHPFQFHPNLSYEDFVRGWRPAGKGMLDLVDGPFIRAIGEAGADLSRPYVVVIEEINRGNPAQIFGEMLTLLEADKRVPEEALVLSYAKEPNKRVHIPPNLHVIGTMNVADRSLALVDFALRRRFAFIDLEPVFGEPWRTWVSEQNGVDQAFLSDIEGRISVLNQTITSDTALGPQFRVGHSVVTPAPGVQITDPREWFTQVVETEIGPHLDECWFDDTAKAQSEREKLLQGLGSW